MPQDTRPIYNPHTIYTNSYTIKEILDIIDMPVVQDSPFLLFRWKTALYCHSANGTKAYTEKFL